MISGTPKADGIAISDVGIIHAGSMIVTATVRFVDSKHGTTQASTKYQGPWSETTVAKIRELLEALERDASKRLLRGLEDGAEQEPKGLDMTPPEGLAEHIGQESI